MKTAEETQPPKRIWGLAPNVLWLGIVSFLTDVSSELIFTLTPLFLANVLGASTAIIGFIAGFTEGTDAVFRIFSGWFSDQVKKRKILALLGYGIATAVKPFMYIAASWSTVLAVRFGDRVGKGIRSSPRDALLADSVTPEERGKSFGVQRALDSAGGVVGVGIAAAIIYALEKGGTELTLPAFKMLVVFGVVPAVLAVIMLLVFVHEPKSKASGSGTRPRLSLRHSLDAFDNRFKLFLAIIVAFTLGNSSDFFIILRAQNLGVSVFHITLMLVIFYAVYAIAATPAGILSDKIGRRRLMIIGWAVYTLVYLGFAVTNSSSAVWYVWALYGVYGIYYGITDGVGRAFVADLVPPEKRGTAYGLYQFVIGFALLAASVIAGWMWQLITPAAPFYFGSIMSFLAMLGMWLVMKERTGKY